MIPTHREPTHPGEMLLEEFLNPLGLTQVEAAQRMAIPLNRLNEIVRKRRGVSADTALLLAQLLGTSPDFWMNLQATWDMYHAAKRLHVDLDAMFSKIAEGKEAAADAPLGVREQRTTAWGPFAEPPRPVSGEGVTIDKTSTADNQYALAA